MSEKNNSYRKNDNETENGSLRFISKENPFAVPDGYFENLPRKIVDKIQAHGRTSRKTAFPLFIRKYRYVFGAVAAGIVILAALTFLIPRQDSVQDLIPDITLTQLLEEKPEYIEYTDEWTLIETLYGDNDLDSAENPNSIEYDTSITKDNIINYLEDVNYSSEYYYNNL